MDEVYINYDVEILPCFLTAVSVEKTTRFIYILGKGEMRIEIPSLSYTPQGCQPEIKKFTFYNSGGEQLYGLTTESPFDTAVLDTDDKSLGGILLYIDAQIQYDDSK